MTNQKTTYSDWTYLDEGNLWMVFSYNGTNEKYTNKVLKIKKQDASQSEACALRLFDPVFYFESLAYFIFGKEMKTYCPIPEPFELQSGFLADLWKVARVLPRDSKRLLSYIQPNEKHVYLLDNLNFSSSLSPQNNILYFEFKPKIGLYHSFAFGQGPCYSCLNSLSKDRLQDFASNKACTLALACKDSRAYQDFFCQLLRRRFSGVKLRLNAQKIPNFSSFLKTCQSFFDSSKKNHFSFEDFACLVSEILLADSILTKLLMASNRFGDISIDKAYQAYCRLSVASPDFQLARNKSAELLTRVFSAPEPDSDKARDQDSDADLLYILKYLSLKTIRDASVVLSLSLDAGDGSLKSHLNKKIIYKNKAFIYCIKIIDLDEKLVSSIPLYYEIFLRLVALSEKIKAECGNSRSCSMPQ